MTVRGLIVDLFAGGGGASEAILAATGRHPDIALNHDREAVALHTANHPTTRHYCCDIAEADPIAVCGGRRVDLLWASPDCTHHSKARGGKPADKKIRSLAWHVVKWAAKVRPSVIALENVEEFQDWGPLGLDARPIKARKGETFALWCDQLRGLGYQVGYFELIAADYGAPTTRKRLFLIARCDGLPITAPIKTHAPRAKAGVLPPWRAAAEILDFSLPTPSIFGRKKPLAPKIETRIARGIRRFVIEAAVPFIVPVTHNGARRTPGVDDPLNTITSANRGEFSLCAPSLIRTDFKGSRMPGAYDPRNPVNTITSQVGHGIAAMYLGRQFGSTVSGRPLDAPHPTVVSDGGGGKSQVVAAHLSRQFGGSIGSDLGDAMGAVMPGGGGKTQLIAASLDAYYGAGVPASPATPLRTITAKARAGLTAALMEQANTGMVGRDAREPLSTIVGTGSTQRLVTADVAEVSDDIGQLRRAQVLQFLWSHFGHPTPAEAADPLATSIGRLRFGLVILDGQVWQINDIGMRMLTPRKLYSAQGFRADYRIDIDYQGKPLTKTAQIRMAGNSVSPPPAIALLRANLPETLLLKEAA